MEERPTLLHGRIEPIIKLVGLQNHHHAFFIVGFVKAAHQRMFTRVDGQYAEAAQDVTREGDFQPVQMPATPIGSPSARLMRVGTALPQRAGRLYP